MKNNPLANLLLFASISLMTLSSCSQKAPEDILIKTKQALVDLESGQLNMEANLTWKDGQDDFKAKIEMDTLFGKNNSDQRAFDLDVNVDGALNTAEKKADLSGAFELIKSEDRYFVKLNSFETNDSNLQFFGPLLDLYKGQWLYLSEDFIPESIAGVSSGPIDEEKRGQLEALFVQAGLFDIKEDHGIEEVGNREAYHLSLEPNKEGFKNYFRQVALLNGVQMSETELEELALGLDKIEDMQVYVDTEKYYIYKAELNLYSVTPESDSDLKIAFGFEGSHFNESVEIKIPESAQALNPLALPAGLNPTALPETVEEGEDISTEVPISVTE